MLLFFFTENVKHTPIWTKPPLNTTALIGSNVNFSCQVLSAAHVHYAWYHGYHANWTTTGENYWVNEQNETFYLSEGNNSLKVKVKVGTFVISLLSVSAS